MVANQTLRDTLLELSPHPLQCLLPVRVLSFRSCSCDMVTERPSRPRKALLASGSGNIPKVGQSRASFPGKCIASSILGRNGDVSSYLVEIREPPVDNVVEAFGLHPVQLYVMLSLDAHDDITEQNTGFFFHRCKESSGLVGCSLPMPCAVVAFGRSRDDAPWRYRKSAWILVGHELSWRHFASEESGKGARKYNVITCRRQNSCDIHDREWVPMRGPFALQLTLDLLRKPCCTRHS